MCDVDAVSETEAGNIRNPTAPLRGVCEFDPPGEQDSQHLVKVVGVKRLLPVSGTVMQRIAAIADLQRGRPTVSERTNPPVARVV